MASTAPLSSRASYGARGERGGGGRRANALHHVPSAHAPKQQQQRRPRTPPRPCRVGLLLCVPPPSPLPFPNRRASCPQEFHDCADLPGGLLPIIARLRGLRILRISDCHLFAPADANGLANLAGLQELRLQGYQALAENGMAQVRRRFRSARYQGATACR